MKRLAILRKLRRELGAEVFLVGGAVRDLARKKKPNDLDVVVRNVSPAEFQDFLSKRGSLQLVGKSFGVYLFKPRGLDSHIEIAFPRTEVSTGPEHRDFAIVSDPSISIEDDSNRRDFTLNAMYLRLEDVDDHGKFDRKAVIDFHHGLDHIRRRLVVAVGDPEQRIAEDPLRMLRAVVLVARTGYRLDSGTFGAIKRQAHQIEGIAAERIRDELVKIMESNKPSRAFKAMARTGLLKIILPELAACVGCGQNPKYHSYPVFEHLIYAADAACTLTERLDVRFGALFHDLGKAQTRAVRPGGGGPQDVTFHNHEIASTQLTFNLMKRLKFPKEFTEKVVHLVRWHQYKYDRTWTDRATRRFIRNCGIEQADLADLDQHPQFLLRQADRMGNAEKAHLPITPKQRDFQARIAEVYQNSSAHSLRDLKVNGHDLMQVFGLKPSPVVGRTMHYLFDAVEEDPRLNVKERLVELAAKFLSEEGVASREESEEGSISSDASSREVKK